MGSRKCSYDTDAKTKTGGGLPLQFQLDEGCSVDFICFMIS